MKISIAKISNINKIIMNELISKMDLKTQYKIKKFLYKDDKIRSLLGNVMVRNEIINTYNIKNSDIVFSENKYGKPYLEINEKFQFNISHSGQYVMYAIDDEQIGVDVEEVVDIDYKDISRKFFNINEFNYIMKKNPEDQILAFYEIWALKESYIKMKGRGLDIELKSFFVDIKKEKIITQTEKFNKHKFKVFNIDKNYKISVCSLNKKIDKEINIIDTNKLIEEFLDK